MSHPNRSPFRSYGLALGGVAAAWLATRATPGLSEHSPFVLLLTAVLATAWFVGRRPAIAAAFAAVVAGTHVLRDGDFVNAADVIAIVALTVIANALAWVVSDRREHLAALAASEQRYRTLVELMPEPVLIHSDGRWTFANSAAVALFGATDAGQILGRSILESVPLDERRAVGDRIRTATTGEPTPLREARLVRHDGSVAEIEITGVAVAGGNQVLVVMRDITARKAAERDRLRTTAMLRAVIDACPLPIVAMDDHTNVQLWSRTAERLFGWTADEVLGRPLPLVPVQQEAEFRKASAELMAGSEIPPFDTRRRRKDGTLVDVTVATAPVFRGETGSSLSVAVLTDNTERNARDRVLRASEQRYRSLFAHMQEGCAIHELVVDAANRPIDYLVLDVNGAYERLMNVGYDDVVGRRASDVYGPGLLRWLDLYAGVVTTGEPVAFEAPLESVNKTFAISAFRVGRLRFATTFQDVTEHRRLEAEFLQAQKMEAIGRLAGGVAHDFNNLLTAILGFAEMAAADLPESAAARHDIVQIQRAGDRAASLTRQLLAFGRKQVLQPAVIDLIEHVRGDERFLARVIGEHIRVVLHLPDAPACVMADPVQIDQVVLNLAVNARDAMPNGGVLTIGVDRVEVDKTALDLEPGRYVQLSVSDTGEGMSADVRRRLFEPFFTTKAKGKGTGLGLATVYGIVKQSGGSIAVSSEPGHGATFRVYLPAVDGVAATAGEAGGSRRQSAPGATTLLIVDDEPAVAALAERVLTREGYTVLAALDPAQAIQVARDHAGTIDLLVTDVVMPGIDGVALAQSLRSSRPAIRVVYMSGYADVEVIDHAVHDPGARFLEKPFAPQALARTVREVLGPAPA